MLDLGANIECDADNLVQFALMGDADPEWFSKYRKQLDIVAARKALKAAEAVVFE